MSGGNDEFRMPPKPLEVQYNQTCLEVYSTGHDGKASFWRRLNVYVPVDWIERLDFDE